MVDLSLRKIFQDNLSRLLSEKNVTQKDLAQYMVVSAPTVNDWVKGRKIPRMDKIDKLCIFFGVNRSDLIEQKTASVQSPLMQPSKHGVRIPVLGKVVAGILLHEIMDRLGHAGDMTTRLIYLHITKERKHAAADAFSALMRSAK